MKTCLLVITLLICISQETFAGETKQLFINFLKKVKRHSYYPKLKFIKNPHVDQDLMLKIDRLIQKNMTRANKLKVGPNPNIVERNINGTQVIDMLEELEPYNGKARYLIYRRETLPNGRIKYRKFNADQTNDLVVSAKVDKEGNLVREFKRLELDYYHREPGYTYSWTETYEPLDGDPRFQVVTTKVLKYTYTKRNQSLTPGARTDPSIEQSEIETTLKIKKNSANKLRKVTVTENTTDASGKVKTLSVDAELDDFHADSVSVPIINVNIDSVDPEQLWVTTRTGDQHLFVRSYNHLSKKYEYVYDHTNWMKINSDFYRANVFEFNPLAGLPKTTVTTADVNGLSIGGSAK